MKDAHVDRVGERSESALLGRGELQRRAVAGSFWTAAHALVAAPLAFVVNAVVARVLGPAEYGGLALLTLALGIATQLSNLGVSDATIQWGAAAAVRGARDEVARLLSKSLGFHVVVQLPLLVATVLVLARNDGFIAAVLVLSVVLPAALGSAALLITIENRTASGAKLAMLSNLIVQVGILGAALTTESPAWVWAVRALAGSLLLPLNFLLLDAWGRRAARTIALPRHMPNGFWHFAAATMAAGIAGMLVFSRSEIVALGWFSDPAVVGLFALAFGVAAQVTAPVDALMGPLAPAAAGLVSGHPGQIRAGRERAVRASAFLSGAVLAVVVPPLVAAVPLLYGAAYTEARVPLLILSATSCLQSVCGPLVAFANARRQAGKVLRITMVALVVDVVLALALIPKLDLVGALAANSGGQLTFLVLLIRLEAANERQSWLRVAASTRAWGVGLAAALVAISVSSLSSTYTAVAGVASAFSGALVYLLGVRMFRAGMTEADWQALGGALPAPMRPPIRWAAILFGARS